jgi:plasmid stabilization system protein ParE
MRYTVTWHPSAEDELARFWLDAPVRSAVTTAADRIDQILGTDSDTKGEEFYGNRLLVEMPLAVIFAVHPDDRRVEVLQVWHR